MGSQTLDLIVAICLICAVCAVVSAIACVGVWRAARTAIENERRDDDQRDRNIAALSRSIARIEAASEVDDKHTLRPRDLGGIHDKINDIATGLARLEGQQSAQYNALREQLAILHRTRPHIGD